MKSVKFINDAIITRLDGTNVVGTITSVQIPSKIFFSLPPVSHLSAEPLEKAIWSFGDGTKPVIISNRRISVLDEVPHIFRLKNVNDPNTTLTIQVSVFTENDVILPPATVVSNITFRAESNNYVDPEEFKQDILSYYTTSVISDRLAVSISEISRRLAFAPNFINYTYREDMIGDALVKMMKALKDKKFDPLKGNPFSYFTKIAFHAFCNRIKLEKKNRETLATHQAEVYEENMRLFGYTDMTSDYNGDGNSED